MDAEHLQKHTLAYIALFIGAGMLILWRLYYSIIVVIISFIANIIFFFFNSQLTIEELLVNGGLLTGAVMFFSILLIQTRYNLTKKEIIARLALEQSNLLLSDQKRIIEQKNKHITDSIRYAKRIQDAILPSQDRIHQYLPDSFIFFRPLAIVSGDFYWFIHKEGKSIIAAVDCTGHGVPGAFMSMIGNTLLNKVVDTTKNTSPADILFNLRKGVIKALKQSDDINSKDGMDIALCVIDHEKKSLEYAGAFNPLYFISKGKLTQVKANRMPIGSYLDKDVQVFNNHTLNFTSGDLIYIFSDGYADQFGGPTGKKFGARQMRELLQSVAHLPTSEQKEIIISHFDEWKGNHNQLDDVLVIGIRL